MFYADKLYFRKIEVKPWKPWFAWYPVKIEGKRCWLKRIYRRRVVCYADMEEWTRIEYGNAFTLLK